MNKEMSKVCVCVEWSLGIITQYFAYLDFKSFFSQLQSTTCWELF